MQSNAPTPEIYISQLPPERREAVEKLHGMIMASLPEGFAGGMTYGMIAYFVPLTLYPAGYHCDPKLPLPYANLASQKGHIALYHMGIYANPALLEWFTEAYTQQCGKKPDMGKGCIRFKKPEQIPFALIGELMAKVSVAQYIAQFEAAFNRPSKSAKK